ncbi:MAG: 3-hydroxybutyryl-CoA dehydrogenase [Lachnospiraceae bacterium]|nr:3-hydroxybutyryl-CoA dehydrogenase [Lachnospiraceae bacterium]
MKVGVIGAGTMGSGIAQAFAMTDGYEVCLCDIKTEYAEGGLAKIKKNMDFLVGKEKITQEKANEILGKITTGLNDICGDCDLIVEVALEDLKIKQDIFASLQKIVKKDCMFASNTSSLSITKIGEGLDRPLIGMHFFNPADRMKLVEVIKGENTPQEMVDKIKAIATEIGKTPVEVKEAPGFVVNRILIPMINEAINVFDAGTASAEDIDIAMQLGASHPMGPLHLADLIGLDICLAIMEVLHTETGDEKYAPAPLLKKMVADKKLGKKTGVGFFDYSK